jgi:hypothetical protein
VAEIALATFLSLRWEFQQFARLRLPEMLNSLLANARNRPFYRDGVTGADGGSGGPVVSELVSAAACLRGRR